MLLIDWAFYAFLINGPIVAFFLIKHFLFERSGSVPVSYKHTPPKIVRVRWPVRYRVIRLSKTSPIAPDSSE